MIVLVGWGAFLLVEAAIMLVFEPSAVELALQAGVGLAAALAGLMLWRARGAPPGAARTPPLSFATVIAATGLALAAAGAELGLWLVYIGLGTLALGVGGMIREQR